MTPAQVSGRTTVAASRRAAYPSRSRSVIRAQVTTDALIERAKTLTDDLKAMNTKMPTIRRVVAGNRNDLKALQLYQDALEGEHRAKTTKTPCENWRIRSMIWRRTCKRRQKRNSFGRGGKTW